MNKYNLSTLEGMTLAQLEGALSDVINARKAYPAGSLNHEALDLDNTRSQIDTSLVALQGTIKDVRNYLFASTSRKIRFAGTDDNSKINEILTSYTWDSFKSFMASEEEEFSNFLFAF